MNIKVLASIVIAIVIVLGAVFLGDSVSLFSISTKNQNRLESQNGQLVWRDAASGTNIPFQSGDIETKDGKVFRKVDQQPPSELPQNILEKANQFVVSRIGKTFFDKYVLPSNAGSMPSWEYYPADLYCNITDTTDCADQKPATYLMKYVFRIPEKPYVKGNIEFYIDANGNVVVDPERVWRDIHLSNYCNGRLPFCGVRGLPNCVANPKECEFLIDEKRAIEIAAESGLHKEEFTTWTTSFEWEAKVDLPDRIDGYIWKIGGVKNYNSVGVIINAYTGQVIRKYQGYSGAPVSF